MFKKIFVIIVCAILMCGCSKSPKGFPKLVPCTVVVTDNNSPIEGVLVSIQTVPPTDNLSVIAKTDASGKAVMQTQMGTFAKLGIPTGNVVMTLSKVPEVPHTKTQEEQDKMTYKEMVAYDSQREAQRAKMPRVVPPVLNAAKTSPLTKNTSSGDVLEWNVKLEEYKK